MKMLKSDAYPSQSEVLAKFVYEPFPLDPNSDGKLEKLKPLIYRNPWGKTKALGRAGNFRRQNETVYVRWGERQLMLRRLVWIYHMGYNPQSSIYVKNGKKNNSIENLFIIGKKGKIIKGKATS